MKFIFAYCLFFIFTSVALAEANFQKMYDSIKDFNELTNEEELIGQYQIQLSEGKNANGQLFRLEPALGNNSQLVINVVLKKDSLDPLLYLEILGELNYLRDRSKNYHFVDPRQWAEIYWNAQAGDLEAQLELEKIKTASLDQSLDEIKASFKDVGITLNPELGKNHLEKRTSQLEANIQDLEKKLKSQRKENERKWKSGEDLRKRFEKAEQKLDDLLKNNDRKGVRELLESYLPWESMGTVEKTAWKNWLQSIEKPSKDTMVLFRGLDAQDRLFENSEGDFGQMSPMLVKNQGNYTWRLRSYRANRERFGTQSGIGEIEGTAAQKNYSKYVSLMNMMRFHSVDPVGTPFLSFSNLITAARFAEAGLVAVEIDRNRLLPNNISIYPEYEVLVPLIVFADEHVYVDRSATMNTILKSPKQIIGEIEKRIGRKVTSQEIGAAGRIGIKEVNEFRDESLRFFFEEFIKQLK